APTVALQRLARLVEVGLRGLAALEPPLGIKPCQGSGKLLHGLLGVPRLIAEPLCLAPRPPRNPPDPARITPLPPVPFPPGLGLTRRVELPLGSFPLPLYDACEFALGVNYIKAHRHGRPGAGLGSLALSASGCMRQIHPALKPLASIGEAVLQARPV